MSSTNAQMNALVASLKDVRRTAQIGFALLAIGALLSIFRSSFSLFALTGSQLTSFELWRIFTHFAVERNPLILVWSLWSLHQVSSLIEPVWGTQQVVIFLSVVQLFSSFFVALVSLLSFVVIKEYEFFYHVQIAGCGAACAGVFVAVKQYLPDSILLTTPVGRLKNTHLPATCLAVVSLAALLGALRWVVALQVAFGIQTAWTYLRFYQKHEDNEPRGDSSEHFTWASLFPSRIQPFMRTVGTAVFTLLVKLRICKPIVRHVDVSRLDSVNIVLPGLQTRDTERRRQKALRDLTERLSRAQRVETGAWPDMEDIEEDVHVVDKSDIPLSSVLPDSDQAHLHVLAEKPTDPLEDKEEALVDIE